MNSEARANQIHHFRDYIECITKSIEKSIATVFNVMKPKSIPNPTPNVRDVAKPAWAPTLAANKPVRSAKQKCWANSEKFAGNA